MLQRGRKCFTGSCKRITGRFPRLTFYCSARTSIFGNTASCYINKSRPAERRCLRATVTPIERGTIYVAPNDHHLLLEHNKIVVVKGPKENRFRPSIDALFRSAAYVYGPAVVGVVLSGTLQDGASGIYTIKRQGGMAIVQDPQDAIHSSLPENVLEFVEADYISKAADIGALLRVLAENGQQSKKSELSPDEIKRLESEVVIAKNENTFEMGIINMGELTPFTCPECHGTLVRLAEGNILRFRCHTGHAYTASALLEDVSESVEEMLWQCVRVMEEKAMLEKNIAEHLQEINHDDASYI